LATHLAGRYVQFPVYALSFLEFLEFHKLENTNENLIKYMHLGGMPFLIHTGLEPDVVFEYLKNLNGTIILRDVVSRDNIRNIAFLENLTSYLADNVGSIFSALNISKYLKSQQQNVPVQTVLNYLRSLTNAFYIHKVQRAEIIGLKIFEVGEKYYFEDLGLRNTVRSFNFNNDVNKLMENLVYLHLVRNNYRVFVGKHKDNEIDFIGELMGQRIYIQVSYLLVDKSTIEREFGNLLLADDNFPKYVITMDNNSLIESYKGIKRLHLRTFLSSNIYDL
jgi:predicted AAA+ superfamily ATPase